LKEERLKEERKHDMKGKSKLVPVKFGIDGIAKMKSKDLHIFTQEWINNNEIRKYTKGSK
jgi:hypothetical protein